MISLFPMKVIPELQDNKCDVWFSDIFNWTRRSSSCRIAFDLSRCGLWPLVTWLDWSIVVMLAAFRESKCLFREMSWFIGSIKLSRVNVLSREVPIPRRIDWLLAVLGRTAESGIGFTFLYCDSGFIANYHVSKSSEVKELFDLIEWIFRLGVTSIE